MQLKNHREHREEFNFLKDYENKSVEVEFKSRDKYGRDLVKIYTPKYLNLEIVQQGYANKFLVSEEELEIFKKAEENAINNSKGIWNVSSYFNCFFASVFPEEELIELENNCKNINLKDWILKDESRKEYKFENVSINNKLSIKTKRGNNTKEKVFMNFGENMLNNDRDSIYLFDEKGNIAFYYYYGY